MKIIYRRSIRDKAIIFTPIPPQLFNRIREVTKRKNMHNYKKIIFTLTLLTLPFIHGCSNDNNNSTKPPSSMTNSTMVSDQDRGWLNNISEIEAEIFSELKQINGAYYRSMLGSATSDEQIAEYDKVNLLWVKIVSDDNISQIRLSFDENLFNEEIVIDNYLDPMYGGAYTIADKYKLVDAQVEIYVKNRSLYNDIWKESIKAWADKNKKLLK